ncbi:MAG: 4-hydroxythreonine-4-phosphate dehydrogenase PdxA, partial [Hyphomicrobiales bacterium]|nr:4-hydroxythreonine-4-phosphate dehydrogenase PdxA [Hyphomicrobiales bacterium]
MNHGHLPLALTMGEPAGIGPDIVIEAWRRRRAENLPVFYLIGDAGTIAGRARQLDLDCAVEASTAAEAATVFDRALPVVQITSPVVATAGQIAAENAAAVIEAIETAVDHVRSGLAGAVVTNPIHKAALYSAGFEHPGHTEFLAALAERFAPGPHRPVMMLAGPTLRVVPVTVHIALAQVPHILTGDLIVETGRIVANDLRRRFALARPRLVVAGLNPHAGEDGALGREDAEIIAPAVARLVAEGIDAVGPLSADTLFHEEARRTYDAALAMYHDQA